MRKLLSIIALILIYNCVFAQNISVKHGSESKIELKTTSQFLYSDGSFVYQFKYDFKNFNGYIHKVSIKGLNEVGKELVIGKGLGDHNFEALQLYTIKDLIYIFWVTYNKDKNEGEINCRIINKSLKQVGNDAVVSSYEAKNLKQAVNKGEYSVYFSKDSTEILVSNTENLKDRKSFDYEFTILDLKLKQLVSTKFSLEVKDNNFYLKDVLFSNSGKIYLITSRYLDSKERVDGEARKIMTCYAIDATNNKSKEIELDVTNKYVNSVKAFIDKDDNLRCVGVYSDISKKGYSDWGLQGVFYKKINSSDLSTEKSTTNEFDSKLIELISGDKAAKKDRGALDYELKGVLEKPNGGIYVLLEEQWKYTVTKSVSNANGTTSTSSTTYYCAGDVTAISYSQTGKVEWYSNLYKTQTFREDPISQYNSFYYDVQKDNLIIAYFYTASIDEKHDETIVQLVTFNSINGKNTITPLYMSDGLEKGVVPIAGNALSFIKATENNIICEMRTGKSQKCCCLTLAAMASNYRYSVINLK